MKFLIYGASAGVLLLAIFSAEFAQADEGSVAALVCFSDLTIAKRVRESRAVLNDDIPSVTRIETLDLSEAREWVKHQPEAALVEYREKDTPKSFIERVDTRWGWIIPRFGRNGETVSLLERHVRELKGAVYGGNGELHTGLLLVDGPLRSSENVGTLAVPIEDHCVVVPLMVHGSSQNLLNLGKIDFEDSDSGVEGEEGFVVGELVMPTVELGDTVKVSVDARLFFHPQHSSESRVYGFLHIIQSLIAKKALGRSTPRPTPREIRKLVRLLTTYAPGRTAEEVAQEYLTGTGLNDQWIGDPTVVSPVRFVMESSLISALEEMGKTQFAALAETRLKQLMVDADRFVRSKKVVQVLDYWDSKGQLQKRREAKGCLDSKGNFTPMTWEECWSILNIAQDDRWSEYGHIEMTGAISKEERKQARRLIEEVHEVSQEILLSLVPAMEAQYEQVIVPKLKAKLELLGVGVAEREALVGHGRGIIGKVVRENHRRRQLIVEDNDVKGEVMESDAFIGNFVKYLLEGPHFFYDYSGWGAREWHPRLHELPAELRLKSKDRPFVPEIVNAPLRLSLN